MQAALSYMTVLPPACLDFCDHLCMAAAGCDQARARAYLHALHPAAYLTLLHRWALVLMGRPQWQQGLHSCAELGPAHCCLQPAVRGACMVLRLCVLDAPCRANCPIALLASSTVAGCLTWLWSFHRLAAVLRACRCPAVAHTHLNEACCADAPGGLTHMHAALFLCLRRQAARTADS